MKRICVVLINVFFAASMIHAGDVAVFKNLGFSTDSRYLQFAQYGIDSTSQNPYADIFTVDVPRNDFVPGGTFQGRYTSGVSLGDDGQKALFALMDKSLTTRQKYKLDFLNQGRPIYFRILSEANPSDYDHLKVLDYKTGREYAAEVRKTLTRSSSGLESTFYIDLEITDKDGRHLGSYKVGSPRIVRKNVQNYTIVQMILAPNERAMVFVVEKEDADGQGGTSIRYMVETVTF